MARKRLPNRLKGAPWVERPAPTKLRNLSTRWFTYDSRKRTFTADASDLPLVRLELPEEGEGFRMLSQRTGREMLVVQTHVEYGPGEDGEVLWWEFRPANPRQRDLFVAVIYND